MKLKIDLRHYWHVGSGKGQGGHLDAVVRRDGLGLPMLPGRAVKGLLRDAVRTAAAFGWYDDESDPDSIETRLFGSVNPQSGMAGAPLREAAAADHTHTGCLRFGDARLPQAILSAFPLRDGRPSDLVVAFFGAMFSTAIDETTGTAKAQSLRGIEVAVPVPLEASIELLHPAVDEAAVHRQLQRALPLVRGIGAGRHRGYGRAHLEIVLDAGAIA